MRNDNRLKLPKGIEIDINHVPEDFDEQIKKAFAEFTYGTAKDYTYQDKLYFIDLCRQYAWYGEREIYDYEEVDEYIKYRFARELEENGEFMEEGDFLSIDFMVDCFRHGCEKGACNLYGRYGSDDHHVYDRIMEIMARVVKVVMNWEGDE